MELKKIQKIKNGNFRKYHYLIGIKNNIKLECGLLQEWENYMKWKYKQHGINYVRKMMTHPFLIQNIDLICQ